MCQYFSKTEDQCSQAIKQAEKKDFENNMHHLDTMKTIFKAYLINQKCSVQEAVYNILPELKLRRIFQAVYFVNTNLPEQRVQVLLSENLANYQTTAYICPRNQILVAVWKDQIQHSAMETTAI